MLNPKCSKALYVTLYLLVLLFFSRLLDENTAPFPTRLGRKFDLQDNNVRLGVCYLMRMSGWQESLSGNCFHIRLEEALSLLTDGFVRGLGCHS